MSPELAGRFLTGNLVTEYFHTYSVIPYSALLGLVGTITHFLQLGKKNKLKLREAASQGSQMLI